MPIDWVELSRVIPYAGIAAMFAMFALRIIDIYEKRQDKRDAMWIAQLTLQRETHAESLVTQRVAHEANIRERDELWRKDISEGRARSGETLQTVAANMSRLTELIRSLHTVFTTHDAYERETWMHVGQQLAKILDKDRDGEKKK